MIEKNLPEEKQLHVLSHKDPVNEMTELHSIEHLFLVDQPTSIYMLLIKQLKTKAIYEANLVVNILYEFFEQYT
jgi:hypothetical protein